MLQCPTDIPDPAIARYVEQFLVDAPWLRRRVETVSFVDFDTVIRRTTLDVGIAEVQEASRSAPVFPRRPLVPLAMLKKDLLVDFDLRDRAGDALSVVPRDVDAFFAWSSLCAEANRVLSSDLLQDAPDVARQLRAIAYAFPEPGDDPYDAYLRSWETPGWWNQNNRDVWRTLLRDDSLIRHLRDFTFNFILMTQLEMDSALQLVKFSYQQHVPYSELLLLEQLGLQSTELAVVAPAVGWARSYHLSIDAPEEIAVTDIGLFRIQREAVGAALPAESYELRLGAESAQVYTTSSIVPADHVVAVNFRVPIVGYLRALWITSLSMAVILGAGWLYLRRLEFAVHKSAEAAVALLLLAPSLLAVYLVRQGEHAIATRLLRPIRYGLAVAGTAMYVGAGALVLGWQGSILRIVWDVIASIAIAIALGVTLVVILTRRDLKSASRLATAMDRRTVVVVPFSGPSR